MAAIDRVPFQSPIVGGQRATETWLTWFFDLKVFLATLVRRVKTVALVDQEAAIAAKPIPAGSLSRGTYRLSWYLRVTRAATTSSAVQLTIRWIEGGVACSKTFVNLTGNTVGTLDSDTIWFKSDAPGVVTYETSYASVGATKMRHSLDIMLEAA